MSSAYVMAVAARAGFSCTPTTSGNDYGQDFYLKRVRRRPGGSYKGEGDMLEVQAKSTVGLRDLGSVYGYDLDAETYNHMIQERRGGNPVLLVVYRMPSDHTLWLAQDADGLTLSHCAYWEYVDGDFSERSSTQVVHLPKAQVFAFDAFDEIVERCRDIKFASR